MGLNLSIFLAELVGGLVAGSLALVADSFHNLTDLSALVLVLVARRLQRLPASDLHTFGFRRADVLAGVVNALILFAAMGAVLTHGIGRLLNPPEVQGGLMLVVGGIGFLANTLAVWLLHHDPEQDLGLRSAALHLMVDAFSSAAVVIGGWAVWSRGWMVVDPALSLVIAVVAILGALRVMRDGVHIMMEGTPRHLDLGAIRAAMVEIPGVGEVEHLHVWSLASTETSLTATLLVEDQRLSDAAQVLRAVESAVAERFGIRHTVLQVEASPGPGGDGERFRNCCR